MERNIDCMKYRKHTHLAGVDVDIITSEKGVCILTIKDAFFDRGVNVSGNKSDAYFIEFKEDVLPMVVNSGNRKTIARLVQDQKGLSATESRNIGNWIGMQIELYFDPKVKMMGKETGGIRVKEEAPKPISEKELKVLKGKIATITDLKSLNVFYNNLSPKEKVNKDVMTALKEKQIDLKQQ